MTYLMKPGISAPAAENLPLAFDRRRLGLTICEDMWNDSAFWPRPKYACDPVQRLAHKHADLFINISCSPFHRRETRAAARLEILQSHVRQTGRPFVFVNQVGGNDELIFDGNSLALDAQGNLIARGRSFQEDLVMVDTQSRGLLQWEDQPEIEEVHEALLLGLKDYVRKCGFAKRPPGTD